MILCCSTPSARICSHTSSTSRRPSVGGPPRTVNQAEEHEVGMAHAGLRRADVEGPVQEEHLPEGQPAAGSGRRPLEHHPQDDFAQLVELLDHLAGGETAARGDRSIQLGTLGPERNDIRAQRREHSGKEGNEPAAEGPQHLLGTAPPRATPVENQPLGPALRHAGRPLTQPVDQIHRAAERSASRSGRPGRESGQTWS